MKIVLITGLLSLSGILSFAQKITISGSVNDARGKPIAYAFVKDATHSYATYTDPFGNFTLKVDSIDRLIVSAFGFKPIVQEITVPQKTSITLAANGTATTRPIDQEAFKDKLSSEGLTRNISSEYIANQSAVHGSNYFFDHWVHGYAITNLDSMKQNDDGLYNYQKATGSLLFTTNGKAVQEIDKHLIKRFSLYDDQGAYTFENIPEIDTKHFVQVLAEGNRYKIYKLLGTKFFPNDYVNNGMTSTGHNYDEIKDEPVYYVVKIPGGVPQQFALKNKAIKTAFAADVVKVSKYLSDHDTDIDDSYLTDLGAYLNQ